jgi:uncharacterized membrane protein YidH (DUF202 family)
MKWLLFAVSLFTLWVSFNALFMLPGRYTAFNFELAGVGIAVGILAAWLSGKRFTDSDPRKRNRGKIMQTPPVVLCIFILVIFCAMGALKVMASR